VLQQCYSSDGTHRSLRQSRARACEFQPPACVALCRPVPPCAALCRPVPCVRRERLRSVVLRSHILNLEYSQSINTRIPEGPNTGLIRECKTDRVRAGATHTVCAIPANPKRKRPQFTRVGSWFCGSSLFITTQAKPSRIQAIKPRPPRSLFFHSQPGFLRSCSLVKAKYFTVWTTTLLFSSLSLRVFASLSAATTRARASAGRGRG
jgi:hypothetical protein